MNIMEQKRRAARNQVLPASEAEVLNKLFDDELATRLNDLYKAGWTLQSMGNAFNPPRRRSTVRSWMVKRHEPSPLVDKPIPTPRLPKQGYVSRRPVSPGIAPDDLDLIQQLSPLARRYRSKMADDSPQARANLLLTELCLSLHERNVSVRELAEATGVTYRAMARRLGK